MLNNDGENIINVNLKSDDENGEWIQYNLSKNF